MSRNDPQQNAKPVPLRVAPPRRARNSVEAKLDTLLGRYNARQAGNRDGLGVHSDDPIEQLRDRFRRDFIPVFQDVADKYGPQGIDIHLDVERFLAGGNEILIDVAFERVGVRFLGTVLTHRIAFHEMRYSNNIGPAVTSGPTLRTRELTRERFREFICERISKLIRSVLHQQRSITSER